MAQPEEIGAVTDRQIGPVTDHHVGPGVEPDPLETTGYAPGPTDTEPMYTPLPMYPSYPYAAPPYNAQLYAAPYTTSPPAAPAPAATRTGLMIGLTAIGLVVGLVIGATGAALVLRRPTSSPVQAAGPRAADDPSPPEPGPDPSPSATTFGGDLRTLLLPAPRTSHPFAKPISKDGTLSADQVAAAFSDPVRAREVLQEDGFVAGAVLQWHDADDTEVLIKLYQFGSPDEAKSWQYFNRDGYDNDTTLTRQSQIDGIDDSGCWVTKRLDDLGFIDTLGIATQHDIYMLVRVYQPDKQLRSLAIRVMKDQYARLP